MIKTDFRLISEINCCGDDFEYFIHAQTIAVDGDFDYTNQILNSSNARFSYNDKIVLLDLLVQGCCHHLFITLVIILINSLLAVLNLIL